MNERFAYDELIYRGRIAEVHKVGVPMPDGRVVRRDLIRYPGAAVILPVLSDASIVMIRNYRFAVDERLYELPAGMVDPGELPAEAAARELAEETGYRAGRIEPLGWFYTGPGTCDERMHAYLATDLAAGPQELEHYEQIDVEIIPQRQVRRMVLDGRIHDGKTIAALGLYWLGSAAPGEEGSRTAGPAGPQG
ncbi:MAG: NUDIX hydrolase [Planctomycetes bacterium]|nr:NUDIX hydrolase [Planctomycetota bacterium]